MSRAGRFGEWLAEVHIANFLMSLYVCKRARIPLDWHNIRACWYQASGRQFGKIDLTDEEWDNFFDALGIMYEKVSPDPQRGDTPPRP